MLKLLRNGGFRRLDFTLTKLITVSILSSALLTSGCGGGSGEGVHQAASPETGSVKATEAAGAEDSGVTSPNASGITRAASGTPTVISITFPTSVRRNQLVTALARLTTVDGRAVGGRQVSFYVLTTSRYDYSGRRATGNDGVARADINTANLSPGTYYLGVEFEGASSYGPAFPAQAFTVVN